MNRTVEAERLTETRKSWYNMIQRCTNPQHEQYHNYGGRGIKVCDRWLHSFDDFLEDMGIRPYRLTIERKNNNGNYTPDNCVWATRKVQARNKRTNHIVEIEGERHCVAEWAEIFGVHPTTFENERYAANRTMPCSTDEAVKEIARKVGWQSSKPVA